MYYNPNSDKMEHLRLCFLYNLAGVFKAGNSYMIKTRTPWMMKSFLAQLIKSEGLDPNNPNLIFYRGYYSIWEYRKFYCDALARYVKTQVELPEAYSFIKGVKNKVAYLESTFCKLEGHYSDHLLPEILMPEKTGNDLYIIKQVYMKKFSL
jgi:hypothetical protein